MDAPHFGHDCYSKRVFAALTLALALALQTAAEEADKPHIVFVTGDEEYRSEESMPMLARLLEREYGCRCTVLYAQDAQGYIAPNTLDNIPGLKALDDADLMVQFTRFRALPDEQLQHILDYAASGRPMVGFRTATHAFLYPKGSPNAHWSDGYSIEYFGQKWITHHGHSSTTQVTPRKSQKDHPVLRGVKDFHASSWLYHVDGGGDHLPTDAQVLVDGRSLNSEVAEGRQERFPLTQPLAWVRERENGQRVFFTTLGHPYDFRNDSMRTLALNGILWALGREDEIPSYGCDPALLQSYSPTKDAYGGAIPGRRPQALPELWQPRQGAHIAFVGNTMAERMSFHGGFETMLHTAFPEKELQVRNLGWSADTPSLQPRPLNFGSMEEHLASLASDTVFAFFGFNESFAGEEGLGDFRKELEQFVRRVRSRRLADGSYPEIILVSPFAPENIGGRYPENLPLIAQLQPYVAVMQEVADRCQVRFLDLFSFDAYVADGSVVPQDQQSTIDGIHLNSNGDMGVAADMMTALTRDIPYPDDRFLLLKKEVQEKSRQWWYRHRAVNGFYIYGGRKDPFGSVSFPGEMHKLDLLVAAHDRRIHALATAEDPNTVPEVDLSALPELPKIASNFEQEITILSPTEAEAAMTVADGYRATVFASEVDFPELENPVALAFDGKGRLWVAVMPTYPQVVPGERPNGKLLILEDTSGDGRADQRTVFADGLYLPAGFELGDGGAYVAQQPYLMFLEDTDGDDHADRREIVLESFGTEDAHHAISAFTWGPAGGLYMQEGTFHHSQVETPYGPVRVKDGAVFRWEPHTGRFRVHTPFGFWNPWGHVFDAYGQDYIGDASDGNNYLAAPITTDKEYDRYRRGLDSFSVARVRPTAGAEIVTGHMFPQSVQGDYMISNTIGFLGIRAHHLTADGSGVMGNTHWDLLSSKDPNFRPIGMQFGPDGALYFVDWFNPLIGHMQHSIRDPKRDHHHGRVWRVDYVGPDAAPPRSDADTAAAMQDLSALPASALTPLLADSDSRLRYRVRRELWQMPAADVAAAFAAHAPTSEEEALEQFWVRQQQGLLRVSDLETLFRSEDLRIRTALVRAMNMEVSNPTFDDLRAGFLRAAAQDVAPKVRLEAVSMATRMPSLAAVEAVLLVWEQPRDRWLDYALDQALLFLKPVWQQRMQTAWPFLKDHPQANRELARRLDTATLAQILPTAASSQELLLRPDASAAHRRAALDVLAGGQGNAGVAAAAWVKALEQADALADTAPTGLGELVALFDVAALQKVSEDLQHLSFTGRRAEVRQAALAAWMKVLETDGKAPLDPAAAPDVLWQRCAQDPQAMVDALQATRILGKTGAAMRANYLAFLATAPSAWPGCPPNEAPAVTGRTVRIEIFGNRPLTLAEVEVWSGGRNVARGGTATQASEAWGGVPARAIDGNHSGAWNDGSQTHTAEGGKDAWWQVDLGQDFALEEIVLWNRTDESLGDRLQGYRLRILDQDGREVWSLDNQDAPAPVTHHRLQVDWPGKVQRGSLRALVAGNSLPTNPSFGRSLFGILQQTPLADRGQDWIQESLGLLELMGRKQEARQLRVQILDIHLNGTPASASPASLTVVAGMPVELRVHNDSPRWQAVGLLARAQLAALAPDTPQARFATDPQLLRAQDVFRMHCLSCHAPDGGGLVGPDMTDDLYLHVKAPQDMPKLIRDGFLEMGMTPFKGVLTDQEIADVAVYMASLRGTIPASAKAPQGELIPPWESPAERLARLDIESLGHTEAIAPGDIGLLHFQVDQATVNLSLSGILAGGEDLLIPVKVTAADQN